MESITPIPTSPVIVRGHQILLDLKDEAEAEAMIGTEKCVSDMPCCGDDQTSDGSSITTGDESHEDVIIRGKASLASDTERDPLTLEPLPHPDSGLLFTFRPSDTKNTTVCYNITTLIAYYLKTSRRVDPVTSIPLTKQHIADLERAARGAGLPKANLTPTPDEQEAADEDHRTGAICSNYESLGGDVVASLLRLIDESDDDDDAADIETTVLCSQLENIVTEYKLCSLEKAFFFLRSSESYIQGPTRAPTKKCDRLHAVEVFLKGLWTSKDERLLNVYRENVAEETLQLSSSPASVASTLLRESAHMPHP